MVSEEHRKETQSSQALAMRKHRKDFRGKTLQCLCNDRYQFTRAKHKCKHSNEKHKQDETAAG